MCLCVYNDYTRVSIHFTKCACVYASVTVSSVGDWYLTLLFCRSACIDDMSVSNYMYKQHRYKWGAQ